MTDPDTELEDLPPRVEECVRSVKDEGHDQSSAIAICKAMDNKGQLADIDFDEIDRENAAADEGVRLLATHFDGAGSVSRAEEKDGSVRYRNILLIAPGEWTDAASEETLFYSPQAMQTIAEAPEEHVIDTAVNINHEHRDQLKQVGHLDPETLTTNDQGALFGDIVLHGRTSASKDAIGLMDLALETEGEQGAGGFSVEIPFDGERTEWDSDRGMEKMVEFNLAGGAIVTEAASEPAAFEEQFAERPVAMADAETDAVRVMTAGETALNQPRPGGDMAIDEDDFKELASSVEKVQEELDELGNLKDRLDELLDSDADEGDADPDADEGGEAPADGGEPEPEQSPEQELQDGDEMAVAQDVISRARQEGFDLGEQTAADLMEFIDANLNVSDEEMDALQQVADAYLQAEEAESLDATPAEGLLDFINEQGGADEEPEEEAPDEVEDNEAAASEEQVEELQATIDDLERRLEAVEDEPTEPNSFPEHIGEVNTADATEPTRVLDGFAQDGDYYTR